MSDLTPSANEDEFGHVWDDGSLAGYPICKKCGWRKGGPHSLKPCKPPRVGPRSDPTPTPSAARNALEYLHPEIALSAYTPTSRGHVATLSRVLDAAEAIGRSHFGQSNNDSPEVRWWVSKDDLDALAAAMRGEVKT